MSSTRLNYDNCELNQSDIQRVDALQYHMFTPKYSQHNFCNTTSKTCKLDSVSRTEDRERLITIEYKTV